MASDLCWYKYRLAAHTATKCVPDREGQGRSGHTCRPPFLFETARRHPMYVFIPVYHFCVVKALADRQVQEKNEFGDVKPAIK